MSRRFGYAPSNSIEAPGHQRIGSGFPKRQGAFRESPKERGHSASRRTALAGELFPRQHNQAGVLPKVGDGNRQGMRRGSGASTARASGGCAASCQKQRSQSPTGGKRRLAHGSDRAGDWLQGSAMPRRQSGGPLSRDLASEQSGRGPKRRITAAARDRERHDTGERQLPRDRGIAVEHFNALIDEVERGPHDHGYDQGPQDRRPRKGAAQRLVT